MDTQLLHFIIVTLKLVIPFAIILTFIPLLVWLERKGSAFIQDRPGPNRAAIMGIRLCGLIHPFADAMKLMFKEDIIPSQVHKFFYVLAPFIALSVASVTFLVIPFAAPMPFGGGVLSFQAANINAGVLYILAMTSMGVFGIMLAGWASNNKFARLGGLRSSAQMISYELSMGLAVISVIMWAGSLALNDIVSLQGANILRWNFIYDPLACLIFITAAFAETNRTPFDLPEGESELVAGYHTEYSSMKFSMFFMAEYANMVIASALIVTLFFGGWQIPFLDTNTFRTNADYYLYYFLVAAAVCCVILGTFLSIKFKKGRFGDKRDYEPLVFGVPAVVAGLAIFCLLVVLGRFPLPLEAANWIVAVCQIFTFLFKVLLMCWVFIWVRWTVPRIRYDQLMDLGWKFMLPLAMLNIVITAVRMLWQ
ncbi:MAG: NADH-quinone oxidoreductase subunit H [Deltaproteobacteria bacterium]|nr:NADH-quinone oxidoreductase subunit H [Deltaproteobacteria bacterium]